MKASEIRQAFLDYFKEQAHTVMRSSSLIPGNDPSLLFTNAGMVQFKGVFIGEEARQVPRATTSQKCLRITGKHNDLENVGETARHHTFFEMLGNFSFGDYFKDDAIKFAWEFLVERMKLPEGKLLITVFKDDDDAFDIWHNKIGLPKDRIFRLGEKDNYWSMGDTGPCGPCSEILIDQGESVGCGKPTCAVGCKCDRFLEIWNLVFMQYNRDAKGKMTPLPKPSIDTGMGLERVTAIKQKKITNYDTDLFMPLIELGSRISGKPCGKAEDSDTSLRVIADHSRATAFLITDGVLPLNEGRGYALRRIMRRAIRHGKLLGLNDPFLYKVSAKVVEIMGDAYPELKDKGAYISEVVKAEEERFFETLEKGLKLFEDEADKLTAKKEKTFPGDVAFTLYDTYGFPPDLTDLMSKEKGLRLDQKGFDEAMQGQRQRSREHWKGFGEDSDAGTASAEEIVREITKAGVKTDDSSKYTALECNAKVELIFVGKSRKATFDGHGEEFLVVTDKTPFYAKSGGQVGDVGSMEGSFCRGENFVAKVLDVTKARGKHIIHTCTLESGSISEGDTALLKVETYSRSATMRNHTATHLLQRALQNALGDHIKQQGSLVDPKKLRFDFNHFQAIPQEKLQQIEMEVNRKILENREVATKVIPYEEAIDSGAIALFGEKYGDEVRLVAVDDYSKELCGGTHVHRTGDIGLFKITYEGSTAAGIRRIEALTGTVALGYIHDTETSLKEAAAALKADPRDLPARIEKLKQEVKKLEKNLKAAKEAGASLSVQAHEVREVNGVKVLAKKVEVESVKELRGISDRYLENIGVGIVLVGTVVNGKVGLVLKVSKGLSEKYSAKELIKEPASLVGGTGGGRPDMAQAGGTNPDGLNRALQKIYELI